MYEYKAIVSEVVDGDTVGLDVDLGFSITHHIRLRLLNVFAPETRTKDASEKIKGHESKVFLTDLVLDKQVVVTTNLDKTFDRYVGTIYLDDLNINQHIVDQGYATFSA